MVNYLNEMNTSSGGKLLEIVKEYKYLGIFFSKSGSFAKTKQYPSITAAFFLLRRAYVGSAP